MLLLNVSDIHFNHPACNTQMDPDRPFRTRLIQDARHRVAQLGNVDAILVSGDVAFKGIKDEYEAAYEWLCDLAAACNCPLERVFVIPGNHDVDRDRTRRDQSVINVQRALSGVPPAERERELRAQFTHKDTGRALLSPVDGYNEFAARFSCQIYAPEKLFWHQDLDLDEHTKLRIYGVTSTLLSGMSGQNDRKGTLYLSPLQTVLDPADGVINLLMCHHPPDWLLDHEDVDDAVNGRALVQFFGHKHRTRIHRDAHYVRFSAGAVNPDRNEPGWEPGYNFVNLSIANEGERRYLDIEAHLLVWQTNPDLFRPKHDNNDEHVYRHRISLPRFHDRPLGVTPSPAKAQEFPVDRVPRDNPSESAERDPAMSDRDSRSIVLRFWNLRSSQRREIAIELGLLGNEEIQSLPEPERYGRALARAGERGLLERVAEEIEKREER
jgi:3',5'-cyclic AMP phosphodiesterase CpdA